MPHLIAQEDQRKTIKVIKVLRVKCALATGIAKETAMAYNTRCFLFKHGDHH